MQPLGKMFGWSSTLLRFMAERMMPAETVAFFGGKQTDLLGDYLVTHYRADSRAEGVSRYIHIEAGWKDDDPLDPVGETAWLDGLADGPAAIIGHADLSRGGAVGEVLAAHKRASDRFRGIRHSLSWHEADGVMNFASSAELSRTSSFRAGFDQLAEHNCSFEAWCYSTQLTEVADLAAHNPDVPMVLCHVGTPVGWAGPFGGVGSTEAERDGIARQWQDDISALAEQPHVHCKLSGLLMPVIGFGYEHATVKPTASELVDRLSPLLTHCIESFGPERCMVASNFPVDRVSCSYGAWMEAMVQITASHGAEAQAHLLRDTATRFYRL